jgi:hypothetical protein
MVATPVLQFGMYSSKYYTKDTQTVTQIYINGNLIDYTNYSAPERDLMISYPDMYMNQKGINSSCFQTMKAILNRIGIGSWMKEEVYSNQVNDEQFTAWYKKLLEKITGEEINRLELSYQKYLWNGDQLAPLMTPIKIDNIAVK